MDRREALGMDLTERILAIEPLGAHRCSLCEDELYPMTMCHQCAADDGTGRHDNFICPKCGLSLQLLDHKRIPFNGDCQCEWDLPELEDLGR